MSTDLSICITYYDAPEYLRRCLASIGAHPPARSYEILIVDDASPRPAAAVAADVPLCRVVRTPTNVGFTRANNIGFGHSSGRYVLFLNCDTEVFSGALDHLANYLDAHPDAGAAGPMLLNADGSLQPQAKRGRLTPLTGLSYSLGLDRRFPRSRFLAQYLMRYVDPSQTADVAALSGSCMMVRADAFRRIGGFDESLVQYAEDLDLCYRLGAAGLRIVYLPQARVTHFGGQGGTHRLFLRSLYHYHRSLWMLFSRYRGPLFSLVGWAVALLLAVRFGAVALRSLWAGRLVGTPKGTLVGGKAGR